MWHNYTMKQELFHKVRMRVIKEVGEAENVLYQAVTNSLRILCASLCGFAKNSPHLVGILEANCTPQKSLVRDIKKKFFFCFVTEGRGSVE